ncbi:DNA-directed RNA polymerase I subunit RPA2 [Nasonia vitripennis]|uniref:DNA-directed RNA polymerase subunit beta n=1 Tax=Nasonia vitripennis TaxID=7425 RepID=A0A7M7GBJ3_NASVI|nr:DNA-directed RNA polymerase I subunit RPA2 [Nasonia vitripennis]
MLIEPKLTNTAPDFGQPAAKQNPLLQRLGAPHIDSFNYALGQGLTEAIDNLLPVYLTLASGDRIELRIEDVTINHPTVPSGTIGVKNHKIYPTECRQRAATYKGKINAKIGWSINGRKQETVERSLGEVPIMVKSNKCHLNNMKPAQLVAVKEHEQEWGGYFIIKGHERLIRMLLMTRRNYPIAIKRSGWKQRGDQFSDLGILLRCVRDDNTATNNSLHYVTDGSAKLMFTHRKVLYYVPLILMLKCLMNVSDKYIYNALTAGCDDDVYYKNCVLNMMRTVHEKDLHSHEQCKAYIGKMFRIKFYELPVNATDIEVCDFIIKYCIAIHLDDPADKFHLLCFMTKKLFALADNKCAVEGADAVMVQECLLGGHLYLQVIKEKLYSWLMGLRSVIVRRAKNVGNNFTLNVQEMLNALKSCGTFDSQMENFLATGNVRSQTGLGLMQSTGLSIVAENINRMRYMSHFRAIHRGSFFQEMRTTEARQLLPDAWGFICPVHTPDGAPCGLLNHLTMNCIVTKHPDPKLKNAIPTILLDLGMLPMSIADDWKNSYTVVLDGRVIGLIEDNIVGRVVDKLRVLKINEKVPPTMEIVLVPKKNVPSQYPGVFLFTGPTRMMRPVKNLSVNKTELIGTFEQVYLNICVTAEEADEGLTTHQELSKTTFLSNLACLIPMPDCNQSPRNMYQCQMGKQTMGTPCLTWQQQAETKLYRLQTPSTPLFRPVHHDNINLDEFAMGTNAIVAVISYTGYDMEDAMIINKSAYERGFAHGMIYKSEFIELKEQSDYFARDPNRADLVDKLDSDGLPNPGTILQEGDPYYSYYQVDHKTFLIGKYKGKEAAFVDNIKLCGSLQSSTKGKVCITLRISRNPSVGDKFASRAGQKGICSQKWPAEDLPFTETGLIPDIVFNPHGFPSRMTIAMMIEVMAGKSGAVHGLVHDATPFRFSENDTAVEYFGKLLEQGGYNYYGTERIYSGIDGREMTADIFFGVVHYQRLRHMVSDKWQVRSTGPIDVLTRQPIKGRRRGGGVRFGEMERDSLISHGCSFLLQDRLFHCSDKTTTLVCKKCGTLLGPVMELAINKAGPGERRMRCRLCGDDGVLGEVDVPYIFRYLVTQLASCNINVKIAFNQK